MTTQNKRLNNGVLRIITTFSKLRTSRTALLSFLPILLLSTLGASCPTQSIPRPSAGSWLVFLCQASDATLEPHTVDYYKELFDRNQRNLIFDYLLKATNSKVDVSGTEVYGWFKMGVNTATIAPNVRNNSTNPNRVQTAQDCKSAGAAALLVSGKTFNPDHYAGFIAIVNVPVDAGAAGQAIVANQNEPVSFYAHEMLHVYGLDHSFVMAKDLSANHVWELGADTPYNDCWDIMSYATCTYRFNTPNHGAHGPELQLAYRQKLGWLPAGSVFVKDQADRSPSTVTLSPVSEPTGPGPLMAVVELTSGAKYVIEYRIKQGFDQGIPNNAVVIRELRSNGNTYLVKRQNQSIGWAQGEQFTDVGNFLSITVDETKPLSAKITINPVLSIGVQIGEICGNKFVGQIHQCPTNSVCDARRTRPLVSVDYFCQ